MDNPIKLFPVPINVRYINKKWVGHGAEAMNRPSFPWPERIMEMKLFDCRIFIREGLEELFTEIPTVQPFQVIPTGPSPRLQGILLVEALPHD